MNFRAASADWGGRRSWIESANDDAWHRFGEGATPRQLQLFGFPPPGHPYWTAATLLGVAERYPTLDLTPWHDTTQRG